METKVNTTVVGAFVLLLGAALIAAAFWLASGGQWGARYDTYLAVEDESVSGLNLNAPVKYSGVDVGKVAEITLDHDKPERVVLRLAIARGTPVKRDTVATLKTQGLTGIAYVELSGGSAAAPLLVAENGNPYPVIRTVPSLAARLENVLGTVLSKLDSTSNAINALLSESNRTAFASTLSNLASVTQALATHREQLTATLAHADRAFANVERASTQLQPLLTRADHAAGAIERMGDEVARTSAGAGKTIEQVGVDLKRFSTDTLPELDRLLNELATLSTSLRRLSEQTQRDTRGLLFGREPPVPGPGETGGPP